MPTMYLQDTYRSLLDSIRQTYQSGQAAALREARRRLVLTYWGIGRHIVEYEQGGEEKAVYGSQLLERLSRDLSHELGRGFNRSNLIYMRLCYLKYPDVENLSHQLNWAHLLELLKIDHDLERSFYEKQCVLERWTVRELKRQKDELLVEFATYGMSSQLFVSKYQLYLPNEAELRAQLEAILGEY